MNKIFLSSVKNSILYRKCTSIAKHSRLKKLVSYLIVLAILAYLLKNIVINWSIIKIEFGKFHYGVFLLSFIFLCLHNIFNIKGWQLILQELGENLSYNQCLHIWMYAQMGRYLPGKIWMLLGRIHLAQQAGLNAIKSACSVYVELAASSVAALTLGALALLQIGLSLPTNHELLIYGSIVALLILVHPTIFEKCLNIGLRLLKRPVISIPLSFASIVKLIAFYVTGWQLSGIVLFLFVSPFASVNFYSIPLLAGTAAMAWLIGLVSVFSPSGLGVREGILTLLLSHFIPLPIAATIALLLRILNTLTEMFLFLLAFFVKSFKKDTLCPGEK
jgi:uncharacterized membrane protein YbhN (UPF0104 family)